ncbi:MAG: helix-turn-helix domain-containing protein [Woeseiaceae bacterium]
MPAQSPYRVRSLSRGLRVLAALNARGSATLAQLAVDTGLAKPTAFRILKTLLEEEYISKEDGSDAYQPAARVSSLSSGFEESAWFIEHTQGHLETLATKLVWPLSISTLAGTRLQVRGNTDANSALAVRRLAPGMTLPILESASGIVLLAYSDQNKRERILERLRLSKDQCDLVSRDTARTESLLGDAHKLGYATVTVTRRISDLTTLAVPILVKDTAVAALAIRFSATGVPKDRVLKDFLPTMRQCAQTIGSAIAEDSRAARIFGSD